MPLTMYSASVPVLATMLGNLIHLLDKGQAHAEARKFDPTALLQARLAPDMFPLSRQVQIACDNAKIGIARIAGVEAPVFEDVETTIPELNQRIRKTLDFLASVPAEKINGTENKDIVFPSAGSTRTMSGEDYLRHWMLPNVFFHVTTAYALLRHNGVAIGKRDYLAGSRAV